MISNDTFIINELKHYPQPDTIKEKYRKLLSCTEDMKCFLGWKFDAIWVLYDGKEDGLSRKGQYKNGDGKIENYYERKINLISTYIEGKLPKEYFLNKNLQNILMKKEI